MEMEEGACFQGTTPTRLALVWCPGCPSFLLVTLGGFQRAFEPSIKLGLLHSMSCPHSQPLAELTQQTECNALASSSRHQHS